MMDDHETQQPEHGLEILRKTGCRVGAHLWTRTSAGAGGAFYAGQTCECGVIRWPVEAVTA